MSQPQTIDAMLEQAAEALRGASVHDRPRLGAITLHVLALHGRLQRALDRLPHVVGDDVPWARMGDRDAYVASVAGTLAFQRRRIAELSDLRDPAALLASCRLSLQTLRAVARDVTGILPVPSRRPAAA